MYRQLRDIMWVKFLVLVEDARLNWLKTSPKAILSHIGMSTSQRIIGAHRFKIADTLL